MAFTLRIDAPPLLHHDIPSVHLQCECTVRFASAA